MGAKHKVTFEGGASAEWINVYVNGVPEGTLRSTGDGFWIVDLDNGKSKHCRGVQAAKRWARENVTQTVTLEQWERGW